ncbi:uncharacterized protein LOC117343563 [Pecten maximus]|uniref:uncharacterized protein LOC117343563 n=1 Tax=Pecten maximus TaxID=6579 RepID=UPI001458F749|nr:uncharacterized protein LOC117343563 [Pecten maximus]XP_033761875.1 uncharacterized protein LOC117343563 [Pecten maximus]
MAARILEFWRVNSGVIHFTLGTAWACIGYGTWYAVDEKKDNVSLYHGKKPVEVDTSTLTISQSVDEDLKSKKAVLRKSNLLRPPYVTVGSEAESIGSLKTTIGGAVGVPYYWRYSTSQDVETVKISLFKKGNTALQKWIKAFDNFVNARPKSSEYSILTTNDGDCDVVETEGEGTALENLKESLILSEDAKTFGYMHEIRCLNSHYQNVVIGLGIFSLTMGGTFGYLTQILLQKNNRLRPGHILRIVVLAHIVAYSVSLNWFKTGMDLYLRQKDVDIDKDLMDSGLTKGGIEYYDKLIQKNISLRTLLGPKGEHLYKENGNVIYQNHRNPHLPLTQRRNKLAAAVN